MDKGLIYEVKKKKEFSKLPDSIVFRALEESLGDVKEARAKLRKYFSVFLTNKVLKLKDESILKSHISSKKRDYEKFYLEIFKDIKKPDLVIDIGCGVNGFSYKSLEEAIGNFKYIGIEASGQLVESMNSYFEKNNLNARAVNNDILDKNFILDLFEKEKGSKAVFLFQVIDSLENFKKDFSKDLISFLVKKSEMVFISYSLKSISGKKKFRINRKWLTDWIEEMFEIKKDFEAFDERFLVISKK